MNAPGLGTSLDQILARYEAAPVFDDGTSGCDACGDPVGYYDARIDGHLCNTCFGLVGGAA
jgi:hypothetical protein